MKRFLTLAFLGLHSACGSSKTAPIPVASVDVTAATNLIEVGQTLNVTATPRDAGGNALTGRSVTWSSSANSVATVSASGMVSALGSGTVTISATVGSASGQLLITVTASSIADCTGVTPLSLALGEVRVLAGGERSRLCVAGGAAGSGYSIAFVNISKARLSASITVAATNIAPPNAATLAAPVAPAVVPNVDPGRISSPGSIARRMPRNSAFENRLRALWRAERARMPRAAARRRQAAASRAPRTSAEIRDLPATPAVGSMIDLNASSTSACEVPLRRTARVRAVSNSAIVVEDTTAPSGGFTDAEYLSIATTFDTLVFPLDTTLFGAPYDMDANGRVLLFFTTAVNERTAPGSATVIGGFFWERDLIPRTANAIVPASCANSNEGEMFYLPVVDAGSRYNSFFTNKAALLSEINSSTIHELQHLINASHRIYITPEIVEPEEGWLDEGMSHLAEEMLYLRTAGLQARADLTFTQSTTPAPRLDLMTAYQLDNLRNLNTYLLAPASSSAYPLNEDLSTRGASWAMLRWALDHSPGTTESYLHALVSAPRQGIPNFDNVFASVGGLTGAVRGSTVSHFTDNLMAGMSPTYSHLTWNQRDWLPHITVNAGAYPLRARAIFPGVAQTPPMLIGGGSVFMRFSVNPSVTAALSIGYLDSEQTDQIHVMLIRTN